MTYEKMNPKIKEQWLKDLRSGSYSQCTGALCKIGIWTPEGAPVSEVEVHCCLGVLAEQGVTAGILQKSFDPNGSVNRPRFHSTGYVFTGFGDFPREFSQVHFGLDPKARQHLVWMNDVLGFGFSEIADWIEENL